MYRDTQEDKDAYEKNQVEFGELIIVFAGEYYKLKKQYIVLSNEK